MELQVLIPVHAVITYPTFFGILDECIWYLAADATLKCQIRIVPQFELEVLVEVRHLKQITCENSKRYIESHLLFDCTVFLGYYFEGLDNIVLTEVVCDFALGDLSITSCKQDAHAVARVEQRSYCEK